MIEGRNILEESPLIKEVCLDIHEIKWWNPNLINIYDVPPGTTHTMNIEYDEENKFCKLHGHLLVFIDIELGYQFVQSEDSNNLQEPENTEEFE